MESKKIEYLLTNIPIISTMVDETHLRVILPQLGKAMAIPGDIVELGCNVGTTSIFIQAFLEGRKPFNVYDSFEGFPDKLPVDEGEEYHFTFEKGGCATTADIFKSIFEDLNIPLPEIHQGWFKDAEYPEKIAFAFFDSDFYSSILDSWEKVYPRLSPGAVVCIHDYGWGVLPGCKAACDEFLKDKPEKIDAVNFIGILVKK